MGKIYNNPASLMGGFKRLEARPIDDSYVVSNFADLMIISKYDGLLCYVTLEDKFYYYNGTAWIEFGIGLPVGITGSIQLKGSNGKFDGYNDFLWDSTNKVFQLS